MAFSENLQFIRTQAGHTQEQMAERLDVSRQSVSKWESGGSYPEMETLLQICDLYGTDLDTLLRGSVSQQRRADTAGYDAFMNRFSRRMAGAVAGILAGVGLMVGLSSLAATEPAELLLVALFLLVITVCVTVLVASGIQYGNFQKKHPTVEDFYTPEQKETFSQRFVWYIAGGVGAILLGVALLVGAFAFLPEKEPYESLVSAVFFFLLSGAVYSFIYGGIQEDKYKVWKYNRDNNPEPAAEKRLSLIGTICAVLMLLCTAVYVALGFARDAWGTAWWVFPVGGILCGAVGTALNPYRGQDD